jgi:hypothetical protein
VDGRGIYGNNDYDVQIGYLEPEKGYIRGGFREFAPITTAAADIIRATRDGSRFTTRISSWTAARRGLKAD